MPTIALIAGELSGDALGAALIRALRGKRNDLRFIGVGGPAMREAGQLQWASYEPLAVMGLVEVLRHLPRLLWFRHRLLGHLRIEQPALVIGIDAPDFNLGLERRLKQHGLRCLHYVSPSVWAWRPARAAKLGRSCDEVLCLFDIEPPIYAQYGVAASFVGHPLAATLAPVGDRASIKQKLGFDPTRPLLALLPGSRRSEVKRLGADFVATALILKQRLPALQIAIPVAGSSLRPMLSALCSGSELRLLDGQAQDLMRAADVGLLASGTAVLEAALLALPAVVAYRIAPLSHWLVTRLKLLQRRHVSLPNILLGTELYREFLQDAVNPGAIADVLEHHLTVQDQRFVLASERLRERLGCDPAERAAERALAWLERG